jgi:hypothetical protein
MPIDDKRKSTIGSGRASIILSKSSSSKKGGNSRKNATPTYSGLQVIENGKNMTPLPLFKVPTNDLGFDNHSFIPGSEPGSPDLPSPNQFNNESLSVSTPPMSPSGGGQDDGSIKSPNRRRASKATESIHKMKRALSITRRASHGEALKQQSTLQQTPHHGHHKHDDDGPTIPNGLKFEDLKKPVHFSLTESKTISLFHIATSCVADDDPKLNAVKTKNAQYVELCAAKIGGSDKYVARSAQTLNNAVKDKTTTTTTTTTKNASSLAIGFVIEDDYKTRQDEEEAIILGESKEKDSDGPRELQKEVSVAVDAALAAPGALLPLDTDSNKSDGTGIGFNLSSGRKSSPRTNEPWSGASSGSENGGYDNEPTIAEVTAQQLKTKVMTSKNLEMSLHTVERAVMQNMFHAKQLRYRGLPNAADDEDSDLVFGGPSNFAASPSSSPLSPAPASPAQTQVVPVLPSTPAAPPNTLEPVAQQTTEGGGGEGGGDTNGQSPGQAASEPISPLPAPPQPSNHRLNQAQKAANVYVDSSTNEEGKSRLSPLFDFICPESKGRIIHAMAFNKTNFDVLAVAYGHKQHQHHGSRANTPTHSPHGGTGERGANMNDKKDNHAHSDDGKGLVAFWSLRNPEYPERLIHTLTGVTALDFSSRIPNLLAVGLQV